MAPPSLSLASIIKINASVIRLLSTVEVYDPPTRHERHDGGGPDGDVLGAPEHDVNEAAHEGGVEAVLRLQARHQRVGDTWQVECLAQRWRYDDVTLRYDGEADGDPGDGVRHGVIQVVVRQPAQDGEAGLHTRHEAVWTR